VRRRDQTANLNPRPPADLEDAFICAFASRFVPDLLSARPTPVWGTPPPPRARAFPPSASGHREVVLTPAQFKLQPRSPVQMTTACFFCAHSGACPLLVPPQKNGAPPFPNHGCLFRGHPSSRTHRVATQEPTVFWGFFSFCCRLCLIFLFFFL